MQYNSLNGVVTKYQIQKGWTNMKRTVINSDVKLTNRLHAAVISKEDFWNKITEYVRSDKMLTKRDFDDYDRKRIKTAQEELIEHLQKNEFADVTFEVLRILLLTSNMTSVNGFWVSNSEPYGYNYKNGLDTHTFKCLDTDDCERGLYTFENGVTMWFFDADDDECHTINVAIYYDGNDFRIYCPVRGNYINLLTEIPVGIGTSDIHDEKRLEKIKAFIATERTKYTSEELEKLTQCCYDEDEKSYRMVDILHLAKYGLCYNESDDIVDMGTGELVEQYDIEAIKSEIQTVFGMLGSDGTGAAPEHTRKATSFS